ncbi:hypothetical protein [Paenibacillus macerans]|uniref:hypothetical protein n=1 Tax=Paenibacillus macerans TaxID=44252 RepID=UPI0020401AC8|nr:hypothetical protein [Paenibacillus macerans]MCM3701498.1 hypothetical protein [Paenibacillus macerans]
MDFFDKLKAGVTEAGSKAKTVVEINRLKMQNNTLQGQINQQYQEMGKRVFEASQGGSWPLGKEAFTENIERILKLKAEIDGNLAQIASLSE